MIGVMITTMTSICTAIRAQLDMTASKEYIDANMLMSVDWDQGSIRLYGQYGKYAKMFRIPFEAILLPPNPQPESETLK